MNFSLAKLGYELEGCKFSGIYFRRVLQSPFLCKVLEINAFL